MDYVVFGTGYGATLMLLGWILRTFGPDFRYRVEEDADPPGGDFILARMSWRRFSAGLGALIATAGMLYVIMTFILIFLSPSNSTGTWVILSCFAVVLIAVAVWTWLYVGRYGTFGIVPERKAEDEIFRTVDESSPDPAVSYGPVAAGVGANASTMDENEDNALFAAPEETDDHGIAERHIRMSRYQGHGPGPVAPGEQAASAVEEVGSHDSGDVPGEVVNEVDDSQEDESLRADDVDDGQPEEDVSIEDASSGSADEATAHEPTADAVASHVSAEEPDEDRSPSDDGAPDDALQDDAEDAPPEPAEDRETETAGTLEDTPEARAEALRRIQDWNPDNT